MASESHNQSKLVVLKELDEKGIQYKKLADFDLIFNSVLFLETSYKWSFEDSQVARVEKVDITPLFQLPTHLSRSS